MSEYPYDNDNTAARVREMNAAWSGCILLALGMLAGVIIGTVITVKVLRGFF